MHTTPRKVVIVAYPDVQTLDVIGPAEVFAQAGGLRRPGRRARPEPLASGPLLPRSVLSEVKGPIDTLLVAGGGAPVLRAVTTALVAGWRAARVRAAAWRPSAAARSSSPRPVSSTAGARPRTGLCDALARALPRRDRRPGPDLRARRPVWTSAGVTAGMDLALALVEEDHGPRVALRGRARAGAVPPRPGGQAQFSAQLAAQAAERDAAARPAGVDRRPPDARSLRRALARARAMSPRHFARVFKDEIGMTPAAYVERARVEGARRLLESTDRTRRERRDALRASAPPRRCAGRSRGASG